MWIVAWERMGILKPPPTRFKHLGVPFAIHHRVEKTSGSEMESIDYQDETEVSPTEWQRRKYRNESRDDDLEHQNENRDDNFESQNECRDNNLRRQNERRDNDLERQNECRDNDWETRNEHRDDNFESQNEC